MRGAVIIALALVAAVAYSVGAARDRATCSAPCVVVLPPDTLEDEWDFDYGWKDGVPRVSVWPVSP